MRIEKSYILLNDICLHAFHGVYAEEREKGTEYVVNLRLEVEGIEGALETDNLDETIDYSAVYHRVKEEMDVPSNLVEYVAGRICKRILNDFSQVCSVWIKIVKKNPPGCCDAGVEMTISRK